MKCGWEILETEGNGVVPAAMLRTPCAHQPWASSVADNHKNSTDFELHHIIFGCTAGSLRWNSSSRFLL